MSGACCSQALVKKKKLLRSHRANYGLVELESELGHQVPLLLPGPHAAPPNHDPEPPWQLGPADKGDEVGIGGIHRDRHPQHGLRWYRCNGRQIFQRLPPPAHGHLGRMATRVHSILGCNLSPWHSGNVRVLHQSTSSLRCGLPLCWLCCLKCHTDTVLIRHGCLHGLGCSERVIIVTGRQLKTGG